MTEHWMSKRLREGRSIALEGNYIKIPAKAFVKFQEIKNKSKGKKQTLYEANLEYLGEE